ncbi:hypoxia-inducible factor 1-alpha-like isoform X2 [Sipha flava]|uniref:Hypoxia-inducible factor 1-alpha-like isoform X2 n=1 Tax=Sipha flava TaxID=143950 RepID=A0A8B8GHZ4_9HEMI|nr:hypoxia-inducible factor 1-alpha-like isoform X2 [Sipha flava]
MENKKPKEKRRNSERRKEKSRDAARSRRSKETEIFTDLGSALPLPESVINQLDKATVMRLTISSFKIMDALSSININEKFDEKNCPPNISEICNKALDGIVLILTADGDIVFISENVSSYLGLSQIDLIGQSIYEFAHLCDQAELKEILTSKDVGVQKSFFIRMKCTITNKGRSVNLKSASYKVLHFTGHSVLNTCAQIRSTILPIEESDSDYESDKKTDSDNKSNNSDLKFNKVNDLSRQIFISIAEPIPHPANIEIPLYKQSKIFFSKHLLDMKYIIVDDVITEYLGYEPDSLVSKSVFDYYHAEDCNSVEKSFKILFQKGQVETNKYRFLSKGGGYVWIVTQATVLNDTKGQKPESIMCINYVVSGVEYGDEIYSLCQVPTVVKPTIEAKPLPPQQQPATAIKKSSTKKVFRPKALVDSTTFLLPSGNGPVYLDVKNQPKVLSAPARAVASSTANVFKKKQQVCSESPKATTANIFAPRTKDMNKGFLTFSDDDTGLTMLKDEPEDLTHLAPTAGDVCVPLDTCGLGHLGFVMSDVLDDLILTDCSLAPFDSLPASSLHDTYSSTSSPSPMQNVGEDLSQQTADLCDPTMSSLLGMDLDNSPNDLDLDLSLKNQYIPMYEDDLYPLLSGDLLWGSDRSPSPKPTTNWHIPTTANMHDTCCKDVPTSPSLAKLLKTEVAAASCKQQQQHFGSSDGDSWGSISKMLHQRYNTGGAIEVTDDHQLDSMCRTNSGVKRVGHNASPTPSPWKRCKQEETAKQGTSNSVLMNLLNNAVENLRDKLVMKKSAVKDEAQPKHRSRLKSSCLLDPGSKAIPSLMDLTEQDYDVNAPADGVLLQGAELLKALEIGNITT